MKKWSTVISICALVLFIALNPTFGSAAQQLQPGSNSNQNKPAAINHLYLPYLSMDYPRQVNSFGFEMGRIANSNGLTLAMGTSVTWIRNLAFDWDLIEPVRQNPPVYDWSAVDESELAAAGYRGLQTIAVVYHTPNWARLGGASNPSTCAAVDPSKMPAFGEFVKAVVARYSKYPYNIKYLEIGNEPDVDPSQVTAHSPFGCWGNINDTNYYGGELYGQMLSNVYPQAKSADPGTHIIIGGLLMDCDPTVTPPPFNKVCIPSLFFSGILKYFQDHALAPQFDMVAFHAYSRYYGNLQYDEHDPNWSNRGGAVLGKVSYLNEVMANYGVSKPIIETESALVCPETYSTTNFDCLNPSDVYYEAQADYVVWLYVRNMAAGVSGSVWYRLDDASWRFSSLLGPGLQPRKAYFSFTFLTHELAGATYVSSNRLYPGQPNPVYQYVFSQPGKHIWVMWSPDEQSNTITTPSGVTAVLDKYGVPVTFGSTISIKSPVYIEIKP